MNDQVQPDIATIVLALATGPLTDLISRLAAYTHAYSIPRSEWNASVHPLGIGHRRGTQSMC